MAGGLKASTRKWYYQQILNVLKKHKKASAATIIYELRKIPQKKYPITEERIVAFLKEMAKLKLITYHRSQQRPNKWGIEE